MTSKERAKLKSIASNMDAILQIGKNPIGDTFLKQVKDALKAREMIKIHVLETCELTPSETASALAEAAGCEVVQLICTSKNTGRTLRKTEGRGPRQVPQKGERIKTRQVRQKKPDPIM